MLPLRRILQTALVIALLAPSALGADPISFTSKPVTNQLYPRDLVTNEAIVEITGTVIDATVDTVIVRHYVDGVLADSLVIDVISTSGIDYSVAIAATKNAHAFTVALVRPGGETLVGSATADNVVSGDVYVVQGQSNAVAREHDGSAAENESNWIRSFGTSNADPVISDSDIDWHIADGDSEYLPGSVGQIGIRIAGRIVNAYSIPVAVLNGAEGGRPIIHFRRNDANPYDITDNYGRLLTRAARAGVADHIRAIIWYQGEHDGDGDAATLPLVYKDRFEQLRADWKDDFSGLEKIYVFQIRDGCGSPSPALRDIQRQLADFWNDVEVMSTTGLDGQLFEGMGLWCHWAYEDGYKQLGFQVYRQIRRDLYGSSVTTAIDPPNPLVVNFGFSGRDEVTVLMRESDDLTWDPGAEQLFSISDGSVGIVSGTVVSNTVVLTLSGQAAESSTLTYADVKGAWPWITNPNGIGLLTFSELPIHAYGDLLPVELLAFTGRQQGSGGVLLEWETGSGSDLAGFEIQHHTQTTGEENNIIESSWHGVGFVENAENGPSEQAYTHIVSEQDPGIQRYRLKVMDLDGSFDFSPVVEVSVEMPSAYLVKNAYPNPFSYETTVIFTVASAQEVSAALYNVLGSQVRSLGRLNASAGTRHTFRIDASGLPSGLYAIRLTGERFTATQQVLLVR
jgi:hypothetical protein